MYSIYSQGIFCVSDIQPGLNFYKQYKTLTLNLVETGIFSTRINRVKMTVKMCVHFRLAQDKHYFTRNKFFLCMKTG